MIIMANKNEHFSALKSKPPSGINHHRPANSRTPNDAEAPPLPPSAVNLTVVMPQFVSAYPGQVMLAARNEDVSPFSSSDEEYYYNEDDDDYDDVLDDCSYKGQGYSYYNNGTRTPRLYRTRNPSAHQMRECSGGGFRQRRSSTHNIRFFSWKSRDAYSSKGARLVSQKDSVPAKLDPRELFTFSDQDYVIPREVREVLREEGVDESTMEAWLKCREVWHRRAEALRFFEMAKANKVAVRVRNDVVRLPPLHHEINQSLEGHHQQLPSHNFKEPTSQLPVSQMQQPLPEIQHKPPSAHSELKPKPEVRWVLSEAEEKRWRTEQQLEMLSVPFCGYRPPRLVLISSRMPWCQSMANAVRRDGSIQYIVYNFDTWTFKDILRECRAQLDHVRKGSKAQSVMIISKGGPGFFYLLKNYVMTPQKLKRSHYKSVREFWKYLSDMVSKLYPEDACLHLIGTELDTSEQGKKLKSELSRLMLPNKVQVCSVCDNTSYGKEQIEYYFDYRKFLLWRSRTLTSIDLQDTLELARSWSSIEEEASKKELIFGKAGHSEEPDEKIDLPKLLVEDTDRGSCGTPGGGDVCGVEDTDRGSCGTPGGGDVCGVEDTDRGSCGTPGGGDVCGVEDTDRGSCGTPGGGDVCGVEDTDRGSYGTPSPTDSSGGGDDGDDDGGGGHAGGGGGGDDGCGDDRGGDGDGEDSQIVDRNNPITEHEQLGLAESGEGGSEAEVGQGGLKILECVEEAENDEKEFATEESERGGIP